MPTESAATRTGGDCPISQEARDDAQRLAALERVAEAARGCIWINDCRCDDAYTGRQMHMANATCGEMDELATALAELNRHSLPGDAK